MPLNTSSPSLEVRFFGRLHIGSAGGGSLQTKFTHQRLLIFAMMLTQQSDVLDREQLAYMVWPDLPEVVARANLRRQIYIIERSLPQADVRWFRCNKNAIGWAAGERTFVDVNEFKRLRASTNPTSALEYYRGDFLPLVDNEWAESYRCWLREEALTLLASAVRETWAAGEMRSCLIYAERLLSLEPWREDAVRYLIDARCRVGDRAGAVAAYRCFRERLFRELGVLPMPETERCFESICNGETPNVSHPILHYSRN
jgi:DNA-binding SARP family transcriptional activator